MKNIFLIFSSAGPNRDFSEGMREQPYWNEHAEFIEDANIYSGPSFPLFIFFFLTFGSRISG